MYFINANISHTGDSQSVEEEVLDDEDMDAEDSGSQKADEKLITEGEGKKRFVTSDFMEFDPASKELIISQ